MNFDQYEIPTLKEYIRSVSSEDRGSQFPIFSLGIPNRFQWDVCKRIGIGKVVNIPTAGGSLISEQTPHIFLNFRDPLGTGALNLCNKNLRDCESLSKKKSSEKIPLSILKLRIDRC